MANKSPCASIAGPAARGRAKPEVATFQTFGLFYSVPGPDVRLSVLSGPCLKSRNLITNQHISRVSGPANDPAVKMFHHKNTGKTRKFQHFADFIAKIGMPPAWQPPMLVVS